MPTLQSVAAAAGVHRSTASRALNADTAHLIGADVVRRVQNEAHRLGYRKDALAAGLRTRRTRLVGVIVPDIANPVFGPILSGVEAALAGSDYQMLIANAHGAPVHDLGIVEGLIARRVEGLILANARRNDAVVTHALERGVPAVLVNRAEENARVAAVVTDDRGGIGLALEHLVALGHRRIGHLAGPAHLSTGAWRRAGFEDAMRRAGLRVDAIAIADAYTRDAGQRAASHLLDAYDVTAVAAANDLLALGLYQELRARGLRCPQDVSVVGFNDMPLVDMVDPPLTSVAIHHHALGEEAARMLLHRLADADAPPEQRVIGTELVVRASTAGVAACEGRAVRPGPTCL